MKKNQSRVDCKKNERKKTSNTIRHNKIHISNVKRSIGGLLGTRVYYIIIILSRDSDHGSHGVYRWL